jgi:hypothetical protein
MTPTARTIVERQFLASRRTTDDNPRLSNDIRRRAFSQRIKHGTRALFSARSFSNCQYR